MTETGNYNAEQNRLQNISAQDFLGFGMHRIVYIRPVEDTEGRRYGMYSADGMPIATTSTPVQAYALAHEHNLSVLSWH